MLREVHGHPQLYLSEVEECAFLFRGKCGANAHYLPLGLPGSMRTSLEPSASSKDPVDFLGLGASSVTSFLMVASSLEAMIATT